MRMDSTQGYTIEAVPNRKPLPWRFPAFLLLLLATAFLYWRSRPYCQVAGHYQGRIGTDFSQEKFQLALTLTQNGALLKGSCELNHQTRGKLVTQRAKLAGTAQGGSFRVEGPFPDGHSIVLEGHPKRTRDGTTLIGESWTLVGGKVGSDRISFKAERLDGRTSPRDLSVKK